MKAVSKRKSNGSGRTIEVAEQLCVLLSANADLLPSIISPKMRGEPRWNLFLLSSLIRRN